MGSGPPTVVSGRLHVLIECAADAADLGLRRLRLPLPLRLDAAEPQDNPGDGGQPHPGTGPPVGCAALPRTYATASRGCGRLVGSARGARSGRRAGAVRRTRATPASAVMEKRGKPSQERSIAGVAGDLAFTRNGMQSRLVPGLARDSVARPAQARTGLACVPVPLLPKGQLTAVAGNRPFPATPPSASPVRMRP